mgnify:CR=1 FL=1
MVTFPNAKINLGLDVVAKRPDGYHNLETIFYPVPLQDILEITVTEEELLLRQRQEMPAKSVAKVGKKTEKKTINPHRLAGINVLGRSIL